MRAVSVFYKLFKPVIYFSAKLFSALPVARELSANLLASGIELLPETYLIVSATASAALALAAFFAISSLSLSAATEFGLLPTALLAAAAALLVFLLAGTSFLINSIAVIKSSLVGKITSVARAEPAGIQLC